MSTNLKYRVLPEPPGDPATQRTQVPFFEFYPMLLSHILLRVISSANDVMSDDWHLTMQSISESTLQEQQRSSTLQEQQRSSTLQEQQRSSTLQEQRSRSVLLCSCSSVAHCKSQHPSHYLDCVVCSVVT
jgi:hypothetical protein